MITRSLTWGRACAAAICAKPDRFANSAEK
jgi:hypothetical protein